jgi:Tfp pilus assembly protein PilO
MDIKAKIKERIDALTPRERVVSVLTLTILMLVAPYMILYSPSEKKLKNREMELKGLRQEVDALASSVSVLKASAEGAGKVTLPEAEEQSRLIAGLSREAVLNQVDFISIAPEGITEKGNFIEMRIKLELRAGYRQLYDFIRSLRMKHAMFAIHALRFETNDAIYPSGIAIVKATTYIKRKT